jgi:hypothetical protein
MIGGRSLQDRRRIVGAWVLKDGRGASARVAVIPAGTWSPLTLDIDLRRVVGRVALGLAAFVGLFAVYEAALFAQSSWGREWAFGNGDLNGYLDGARRFLEVGSPYLPEQLSGAWTPAGHLFMHPPIALLLFVPFLWLPAVVWWAVPLGVTAVLVLQARPSPWQWLAIALCVAWPRSVGSLLAGNSDLWAMMGVALGMRFGWGFALLWVKPTFALFAFLRPHNLRWVTILGLLASLPLAALWIDYATIMQNARVGLDYSVLNLPLVVVPVIALGGGPMGRLRATVAPRFASPPSAARAAPEGSAGASEVEAIAG